jgi:carbon-monoxide dehydrogenase large subunit
VVGVFTGEDLAAAKVGGLGCGWLITDVNGQPMKEPPHPSLAQGKVRYVGDQVAVVIAETLHQARDAAEMIVVDYEVLPAVVKAGDARKPGAPTLHDDAPDNTCYVWSIGDKGAVDQAFSARTTSRRWSSSTTGSSPTPSSRAPRSRAIRAPMMPTPSTSQTRIRTSSACS